MLNHKLKWNIYPGTSITRRGKWETLAKAETRLGGSDVAAGGRDVMDGVAPREGFRSALL